MLGRTLRAALAGACAATLLLAPATAAVADDCPPPPSCSVPGGAPHCDPTPYTAAVIESQPSWYWRLGEDRERALDWLTGVGTSLALGRQVERSVPGAIACDENAAVSLSGATPDGVWESHLVGDPDGVVVPAPGTQSFALAIWVKPRTLDGSSRRIGGHEQQEGGWFVAARSDRLTFSRYQRLPLGTAWSTVTVPRGLPLGRWSFVVAAYGPDRVMRLYVDGAEVGRLASDLQLPPLPPPALPDEPYPDRGRLVLGASGRTWSAGDRSSRMYLEWDGALDEAAVYRRTATPTAAHVRRLWEVGTTGGR